MLSGWARTSATGADVVEVGAAEDAAALAGLPRPGPPQPDLGQPDLGRPDLDQHGLPRPAPSTPGRSPTGSRGVLARGLGRSYGDAAQNAGGRVLDMTGAGRVLRFDPAAGVIEAEAGLSLDTVLRQVVPAGWFVPVTPGTRHVTLGGAVAADVHGKNHHVDGSFAQHVTGLRLLTADGRIRSIGPDTDPDLFWATAGGMGLTGVILTVALRLIPIETSLISVDTERAGDLDDLMDRMERHDADFRYSVAWIDLLARGARTGRSVLTRGDHAPLDALPSRHRGTPLAYAPKALVTVPPVVPGGLLRRSTIAAFNEAWYRKAPRHECARPTGIGAFFHPLDGLHEWNRLYGPRGFLQYQFLVPFGAENTLRTAVQRLSHARVPSFLAVLKRFGPANPAPLSFPAPGWTLALDIPATLPGLPALLDGLDDLILTAGGRLYLAKDSRTNPAHLPRMYPRLDEWRAIRDRADPHTTFTSDLARRLSL
jgi:decaprenylphospho-beta-D-ribofuranose 2-oxidase